jgi:hypothetical protein
LANYQESFEYLGPIFYYKNNAFFLRESKLRSLNENEIKLSHNMISDKLYGLYKDDVLYIYRKGETYCLQILLIQKYDILYKYRRARIPSSYFKEYKNIKIIDFEKQ